ncbi:MAG: helix-turn-helix domain-containing protein [Desulfotignum sp.]
MTKNQTSEVLSANQLKAVKALIAHETVSDAAKACNLARDTLYRYMRDPIFDHELKKAKRILVNRAILSLQQSCRHAATALAAICRDEEAPPSARVSAAREILNQTMKAIEIEGIEERLKSLEDRLNIN